MVPTENVCFNVVGMVRLPFRAFAFRYVIFWKIVRAGDKKSSKNPPMGFMLNITSSFSKMFVSMSLI